MGIRTDVARELFHTITRQYDATGPFYFEMWIRPPGTGKVMCDMAILLKDVPNHRADELLVGFEVKDWSDPVPPSVIKKEYEGYKGQFDYFYFTAPSFAPSVDDLDIDDLGLIKLDGSLEVDETARPQPTYSWCREGFIDRIRINYKQKSDRLERQYPDLTSRVDRQKEVTEFDDDGQQTLGVQTDG